MIMQYELDSQFIYVIKQNKRILNEKKVQIATMNVMFESDISTGF